MYIYYVTIEGKKGCKTKRKFKQETKWRKKKLLIFIYKSMYSVLDIFLKNSVFILSFNFFKNLLLKGYIYEN